MRFLKETSPLHVRVPATGKEYTHAGPHGPYLRPPICKQMRVSESSCDSSRGRRTFSRHTPAIGHHVSVSVSERKHDSWSVGYSNVSVTRPTEYVTEQSASVRQGTLPHSKDRQANSTNGGR
jgi:hypothetical protein